MSEGSYTFAKEKQQYLKVYLKFQDARSETLFKVVGSSAISIPPPWYLKAFHHSCRVLFGVLAAADPLMKKSRMVGTVLHVSSSRRSRPSDNLSELLC